MVTTPAPFSSGPEPVGFWGSESVAAGRVVGDRTAGGERRVSNFLLWNIAYSEVYFSDVLWPDFTATELGRAFEFYALRQRRFGRTSEQIEAVNC